MVSKNKYYAILVVVMSLCLVFFFSSKLWMGDDRVIRNTNYNQLIDVAGWQINLGDAQYSAAAKEMQVKLYKMTMQESINEMDIEVFLGRQSLKKELEYEISPTDKEDVFLITVKNISPDYYYLSFVFSVEPTPEITDDEPLETDVFGNPIKSEETETQTRTVQVDYRLASVPEDIE